MPSWTKAPLMSSMSLPYLAHQRINDRNIHLILENENKNLTRPPGEGRYDAQWNDDFHNALPEQWVKLVDTAGHDPVELVVAATQWAERGRVAQVPLAHQRGGIACVVHQRRQGGQLRKQAEPGVALAAAADGLPGAAAYPDLVTRGHEGEAGGRSDGGVGIAVAEIGCDDKNGVGFLHDA